jgi:uncharacterized protein YdhG (YjbR/CyaY superfamily)
MEVEARLSAAQYIGDVSAGAVSRRGFKKNIDMKGNTTAPRDIDEYIAGFPKDVLDILESIRRTISEAAPEAGEAIKYGMPTFTLRGNLVHFGAFKHHIGLYPVPRDVDEFRDDLAAYEGAKGTARFPLNRPIPLDLIRRIVKFKVARSLAK